MDNKNKIGCIAVFLVLGVLIYIILSVMKFFVNVSIKIAYFILIILIILWLFREIFGKKN